MLFLLEPGNVISILISSDFLKMDSLVSKQNYNKYDNFPVTSVVRLKLFCTNTIVDFYFSGLFSIVDTDYAGSLKIPIVQCFQTEVPHHPVV